MVKITCNHIVRVVIMRRIKRRIKRRKKRRE